MWHAKSKHQYPGIIIHQYDTTSKIRVTRKQLREGSQGPRKMVIKSQNEGCIQRPRRSAIPFLVYHHDPRPRLPTGPAKRIAADSWLGEWKQIKMKEWNTMVNKNIKW